MGDLRRIIEVLEQAERIDMNGREALLVVGDLAELLRDLPTLWMRADRESGNLALIAKAMGLPETSSAADLAARAAPGEAPHA